MADVTVSLCVLCGQQIDSIFDGVFCLVCGGAYHHTCYVGPPVVKSADRCRYCGADFTDARAWRSPDSQSVVVPVPPQGTRSTAVRIVVAAVWAGCT